MLHPLLNYLAAEPIALVIVVAVFGLLVGSFLNVVIYRLPIMMKREWYTECVEEFGLSSTNNTPLTSDTFNLVVPRSRCPHCNYTIKSWQNIPIISFLLQKGCCANCHQPISIRYPIVEASSAILVSIVALHFGYGWLLVGSVLLTWALLALSVIDIDHQLLPDSITMPFLWLGLLFNLFGIFVDLHAAVIGAMLGYLSLWSVYWLFKLVTGKEGMGYGDFKLLAMLGAWLGWQMLPVVVMLSSVVGAIYGITSIWLGKQEKDTPMPFGPFLAGAGWISLLWGENITRAYLEWTIHF